MKIGDYLPTHPVDYVGEILTLSPHGAIQSEAAYRQTVNESQGMTRRVATTGTRPDCSMQIQWDVLTKVEAEAIQRLYLDPARAFGQARAFVWLNPYDAILYAVAFSGALSDEYRAGTLDIAMGLKLRILGVANMIINGDFSADAEGETSPLGWVVTQEGTADSAEVVSTVNGNVFEVVTSATGQSVTLATAEYIAVIPGRAYSITLPIQRISGVASVMLVARCYDADKVEINPPLALVASNDVSDTLTSLLAQFNSSDLPTGTAYVKLVIMLQTMSVGSVQIGGNLEGSGITMISSGVEPVLTVFMEDSPAGGDPQPDDVTDIGDQVWSRDGIYNVVPIGGVWDEAEVDIIALADTPYHKLEAWFGINGDESTYIMVYATATAGLSIDIYVDGVLIDSYYDGDFVANLDIPTNIKVAKGLTRTTIYIDEVDYFDIANEANYPPPDGGKIKICSEDSAGDPWEANVEYVVARRFE